MGSFIKSYETDDAKTVPVICESDDHWVGRNLLHTAFAGEAGSSRRVRYSGNSAIEMRGEDIPMYYPIDAPVLHRRQYFTLTTAQSVARPVIAFLTANGVAVSEAHCSSKDTWVSGDLVHVFSNGSLCDPHANDLPIVALLPKMARKVWNLVRYPEEAPKF